MSQPSTQPSDDPSKSAERRRDWRKRIAWIASFKQTIEIFLRIFSYSSRRDRVFLLVSFVASICAGATLPLMNIIFAYLVKTFTSLLATTSSKDVSRVFMHSINQFVLYTVYLFLGRFVLAYVAMLGFRMSSLKISAAIRLSYLEALFKQPISVHDALPPGQTAAIITITANILQIGISERLSTLIQAISVICTALVIACCYSWSLTLVSSSGLVAIGIWYALMTPVVAKRFEAIQDADRQASGIASEALSSIRMVAACGAESKMVESYNRLVEESKSRGHRMSPVMAMQHSPVFFSIYATFALCFWFAVKLYLGLKFANVQTLVVVLMSVMTILAHISAVAVPLTAAYQAINAAKIFFTIIDAPKPTTEGVRDPEISMNDDIILRSVNFAYPTRPDVKVLNGLNLRFEAGKVTAIVGPSGSGKSTIVGLIERWYELDGDLASNPIVSGSRNSANSTSLPLIRIVITDLFLPKWFYNYAG
jgi:ABC-type multidrug transport system fused ATPase/permease subunit